MYKHLTRFSTYTMLVALLISAVAEFYSIIGLTTIFAGAVIPIIIMGIVLGLGKIIATVWLKINWHRAPIAYKLYLIPAIAVLMFLTSIGCFGFLSHAHSSQSMVSSEVMAKIAVYDEKIATAKENIDSNRRSLRQLDEAVDQVMSRSSSEAGAGRAVEVRRGQQRERGRLQAEIQSEQKNIAALTLERAPIAAEVRKVEAETGPLKYIAAIIYGENPDANLLETSVRWVIILIVAVFDPLALMLLLAAQQGFRWDREREEEDAAEVLRAAEQKEKDANKFAEPPHLIETAAVHDQADPIQEVIPPSPQYEPDDGALSVEQVSQLKEEVAQFTPEESDPTFECCKCGTTLVNAPGIGYFCPNKTCDVMDPFLEEEEPIAITYIPTVPAQYVAPVPDTVPSSVNVANDLITVDSTMTVAVPEVSTVDIVTENVTIEKTLYHPNQGHITFEGKRMSIENLKSIRPDLIMPVSGVMPNKIDFGAHFPTASLSGDTFIRVDVMPHRVYKFNGHKWMQVDKTENTTYLTQISYIRYLIQRLEVNEYDPDLLTYAEQDEIEAYLKSKKLDTNTHN